MRPELKKKRKSGWKMLTMERKVAALYLLLSTDLPQHKIAVHMNCSQRTISKLYREYCDTTVTITRVLKPSKKMMAALLEAYAEEPKIPGL